MIEYIDNISRVNALKNKKDFTGVIIYMKDESALSHILHESLKRSMEIWRKIIDPKFLKFYWVHVSRIKDASDKDLLKERMEFWIPEECYEQYSLDESIQKNKDQISQ